MSRPRTSTAFYCALLVVLAQACRYDGPIDRDRDGSAAVDDCDDLDATVFPGAAETCDGIDQDCDGEVDDGVLTTWWVDADGDGWGDAAAAGTTSCEAPAGTVDQAGDCADSDAERNPGAVEACNGIDDDCDLRADEGVVGAWFNDVDGDGFGDDSSRSDTCFPEVDQLEQGGDCDDQDADAHPGASEVCGDLDDDDCNGVADVGPERTWYSDDDLDGWGDDEETEVTCEPQPGWVTEGGDCRPADPAIHPSAPEPCDGVDNDCSGVIDDDGDLDEDGWLDTACYGGEDCDDADADIYPGAPDICGDGVDDDCDGRDKFCAFEGTIDLALADAKYTAPAAYDAGRQVDVGDINGDGWGDVLVATMYADSYYGGGYIVYGPLSGNHELETAATRLDGALNTMHAGRSVAVADVDGDGIDDAAIGAPGSDTDRTFINFGPVDAKSLPDSDLILNGYLGSEFGHGMDIDDIDGDGQADVVISSYEDSLNGTYAGTVYLFHGPLTAGTIFAPTSADAYMVGAAAGNYMGRYVEVGGDANGDGIGDLLLASPYDSTFAPTQGSVNVVYGPVSGTFDMGSADGIHRGEAASNYAGEGYALADVTGDGLADAIAGALYNSTIATYAGAAYVVEGPASGVTNLADGLTVIRGDTAYQYVGSELRAEDMDGDGAAELIIGAPGAGATSAGAAYLFLLPLTGSLRLGDAAATFVGENAADEAGQGIAMGDLDADGKLDLVLGAPGESTGGTSAGAFYVLYPSW